MMQPIFVPSEAKGKRFDVYLREIFPERSRASIQRSIERGEILLDGKKVTAHHFLKGGEEIRFVEIGSPLEIRSRLPPPINVLAAENDFLIVEKPAGLPVHPGAGVKPPTLVDSLLVAHPEIGAVGEKDRPGIVHRLDKDVSGLMIIARTVRGWEYFKEAFKNRQVKKNYLALVYGSPKKDEGLIERPIARSARRPRMAARGLGQEGREAITRWQVRERFKNAALLEVQIETGRTHQIRAHLLSIGHPIVGDPLYRVKGMKMKNEPPRPFLHAAELSFADPDGVERTYQSALPAELVLLLKGLKQWKP